MSDVDWTQFDGKPESDVECACGATYKSHATYHGNHAHSRKPCPNCGRSGDGSVRGFSTNGVRFSIG